MGNTINAATGKDGRPAGVTGKTVEFTEFSITCLSCGVPIGTSTVRVVLSPGFDYSRLVIGEKYTLDLWNDDSNNGDYKLLAYNEDFDYVELENYAALPEPAPVVPPTFSKVRLLHYLHTLPDPSMIRQETILVNEVGGSDDTLRYYFNLDGWTKYGLQIYLYGGLAGGGTGTSLKAFHTGEIGGDPAAKTYIDITNDIFGTPSLAAAVGLVTTALWELNTHTSANYGFIEIKADSGNDTGSWRIDLTRYR